MERQLEAAVDSMSRDKRNKLQRKLDRKKQHLLAANKHKGQCLQTERQERLRYHLNVIIRYI
jgi:hypothetical protein